MLFNLFVKNMNDLLVNYVSKISRSLEMYIIRNSNSLTLTKISTEWFILYDTNDIL